MSDEFLRINNWLVRVSSIDAIGQDDAKPMLILRSGVKLELSPTEAAEVERVLSPGDWRNSD